jgi:hypothetical protein
MRTGRSALASLARRSLPSWFRYHHLKTYDLSGIAVASVDVSLGLGQNGLGGRVAMNAGGRVWWNMFTQWPVTAQFLYLIALTP